MTPKFASFFPFMSFRAYRPSFVTMSPRQMINRPPRLQYRLMRGLRKTGRITLIVLKAIAIAIGVVLAILVAWVIAIAALV